jgi:hypothetical protein
VPDHARWSKTKELLLAPFAISPIIGRFGLPGLVGFVLFGIGAWQQMTWLKVTGAILAAPMIWALAVLFFVYCPILLVEGIRRRVKGD